MGSSVYFYQEKGRYKEINELSKKAKRDDLIFIHRIPNILNRILTLINTTIAINFKEDKD